MTRAAPGPPPTRPCGPPAPVQSPALAEVIDTQAALDAAMEALRAAPALALDTETDAFFAYRPAICLLQVSVPGRDLLIDPLRRIDLGALGALFANPAHEVILHAAENDVIMMQHQFGWRIAHLFDTQVACFVLGLAPYSLAGVLEARFSVSLDKSMQRSDWSRRPLSPEQVDYAAEDTCHLLALAEDLKERAREAGRLEEIESECRRIAQREWSPEPFDPDGFLRIAGARDLDPVALRILRDLYLLRNSEAEARNRAPYRIAGDAVLMSIARRRPRGPGQGVPESFWSRYGRRVAGVIENAVREGPLTIRRPRREWGEPLPAEVMDRFERLRRWRTEAAKARGVEPFVVGRNDLLMEIAKAGPKALPELEPLLEPFRFREYGSAILAAILDSGAPPPQNR